MIWWTLFILAGAGLGFALGHYRGRTHARLHDHSRVWFEIAEGEADDVVAQLELFCQEQAHDIGALLTLAALDRKRGRVDRAKALHRVVLASSQLSAEHRAAAWAGLGSDLLAQGNSRAAVGALSRAVSLAPRSIPSLRTLARALETAGAWERAAAAWERLEKLLEGTRARDARISRGHALACLALEALDVEDDPRKAQKIAERAVALAPDRGHPWAAKARAEAIVGEIPLALEAWRHAISLCPANAHSLVREALDWAVQAGCRPALIERLAVVLGHARAAPLIVALLDVPELSSQSAGRANLADVVERRAIARAFDCLLRNGEHLDDAGKHALHSLAFPSHWRCGGCGVTVREFSYQCTGCGAWERLRLVGDVESSEG